MHFFDKHFNIILLPKVSLHILILSCYRRFLFTFEYYPVTEGFSSYFNILLPKVSLHISILSCYRRFLFTFQYYPVTKGFSSYFSSPFRFLDGEVAHMSSPVCKYVCFPIPNKSWCKLAKIGPSLFVTEQFTVHATCWRSNLVTLLSDCRQGYAAFGTVRVGWADDRRMAGIFSDLLQPYN